MVTLAQSVTTWARKTKEARTKRNDAIRAMRSDGASLRQIARAAELSVHAIVRIVNGGEKDGTGGT